MGAGERGEVRVGYAALRGLHPLGDAQGSLASGHAAVVTAHEVQRRDADEEKTAAARIQGGVFGGRHSSPESGPRSATGGGQEAPAAPAAEGAAAGLARAAPGLARSRA